MRFRIITLSCATLFLAMPVFPYGALGHETVGAIADMKLAGTPTGAQVTKLLDGITLSRASVLADEIKGWDKMPKGQPKSILLKDHPQLQEQLVAFWEANPPTKAKGSNAPTHKEFHYTDVPAVDGGKYVKGNLGTEPYDIVQMIPFCVRVLSGAEPETNQRKITKPIALILLAHYVGDIHQPLHVGNAYFSSAGNLVNPSKGGKSFPDHGGNGFKIILADEKNSKSTAKSDSNSDAKSSGKKSSKSKGNNLHSFWDTDAVVEALDQVETKLQKQPNHKGKVTDEEVIAWFANSEPKVWKASAQSKPTEWAQTWANDILPMSTQAHERLEFSNVTIKNESASGDATEKKMPDGISYMDWAGQRTEEELHKAGWRLAAIIEASLETKKPKSK
ncbi:MAG: hypothetical protein EXS12_05525 [Phycisphaerales bacterium]|nr:hypothetical protein [Phycisphaerales bacterium]